MVYRLTRLLLLLIFRGVFRTDIIGRGRVPQDCGVLVVSNHISWADPPLLGAVVPRVLNFMAMAELFRKPLLAGLMRGLCAFPVDRTRVDHGAVREAVRRLRAGHCVAIFPEGGIRLTEQSILGGKPVFKPGAGSIAVLGQAAIQPVIIRNSRAPYEWRNWFHRARMSVTFGQPFSLWLPDQMPAEERRRLARETLREQLLKTVELK
jgi:1-acyl-sn-glycerol-3-phosphate acyltransferase